MRDKEALENERKNLTRNLEKQAKLVEALSQAEKNSLTRMVSNDLEHLIHATYTYSCP